MEETHDENQIQKNYSFEKDALTRKNQLDVSDITLQEIKHSNEQIPDKKLDIIEEETNKYIEDLKKGTYNILVSVRVRPLSQKEIEFNENEIVKVLDSKVLILLDPFEYNGHNEIFKNRSREQQYAFDHVFDKNSKQSDIFNNTTKFLLDGIVNGYNATVFAYGSTGAGKTYTMLGTEENSGIIFLTLEELFRKIEINSVEREYHVKLSYLEIYNENIRDLLTNNNLDDNLDLREDPQKGLIVSGIKELNANSCKDIMVQLRKGNKNRTQEATNANETSSRSHAILQVIVDHKDKNSGMTSEFKYGKLSLIDLAGSERASATQNRGIRLIEGANINRSLLALGNCINALCEASEKGTKPHIPFRDSKLTRLLKDSLGGNSRTVMIANVSPSASTFEDTYNTLKYANRAKNIKTTVNRNVLNVQYHISNYNAIINNLRQEINDLRNMLSKKEANITNNPGNGQNSNSMKKVVDRFKNEFRNIFQEELEIKVRQLELEEALNSAVKASEIIKGEEYGGTELEEKLLDLEYKVKFIRSEIESNEEKINDIQKKRENLINSNLKYLNLDKKDIYNDYISLYINSKRVKMETAENDIKNRNLMLEMKAKDDLIREYENQIKLRDKALQQYSGKVENIKTIDEIKHEYQLLPLIKNSNLSANQNQKQEIQVQNKQKSDSSLTLPLINLPNFEKGNFLNDEKKKRKNEPSNNFSSLNQNNYHSNHTQSNIQNINLNNINVIREQANKEKKPKLNSINSLIYKENPKMQGNSSKRSKKYNVNYGNNKIGGISYQNTSHSKPRKLDHSCSVKSIKSIHSQSDISEEVIDIEQSQSLDPKKRMNHFKKDDKIGVIKEIDMESPRFIVSPLKNKKLSSITNQNNLIKKKDLNIFLNKPRKNLSKKPFKI